MEVVSSSYLPHMACSEVHSKFERGLISAVPLHCLLMVLLLAPAAEKMTIKHDILDTSKTKRRIKKLNIKDLVQVNIYNSTPLKLNHPL